MGFRRRSRPVVRQGGAARLWSLCRGGVLLSVRIALSAMALAAIAAAIVYLRLLQGPIALPGMAQMLAEQVSAASGRLQLGVGDVVLTLGEGAETSGLQIRNVEIRSADGQQLLAAPRVGARFHLQDLVHGRLQPMSITLIEPDAQVIRDRDGRVRFGMGRGIGIPLPEGSGERDGFTIVSELIDGVVGDGPPVPELAKLERIEILGANLTFDDRRSGSHWETDGADLRVWRYPEGARAVLDVRPARQGGAAVSLAADRPAGHGRTDLTLTFAGLQSERLARQSRELDWLRLIGGTISGEASVAVERDGTLSGLGGVIAARNGTLRGMGEPVPFETAELRFKADLEFDRLEIERFRLTAPAFDARLTGYADLARRSDGTVEGMAGQFDIGRLRADLPHLFADPLAFDGGHLTARWSVPGRRIEVAEARLTRGPLTLSVEGEARGTGTGWLTDIRAEGEGMTTDDLVAFWPHARSRNARSWVEQHVTQGSIDRLVAQLRLGGAEPQVALDFDYSELRVDYVDGMSPVEDARGSGHLGYHDLYMQVDAGRLSPLPGDPIQLAGSRLAIRGFWGQLPPAEIAVRATGPIQAALAMIDQPPLRLLARLDRELDPIDGNASIEVDLVIPLLNDLRLVDIGVEARAGLSDVATRFAISPERSVDLRSERLELAADPSALRLSGPARIEGASVSLDWQETFSAGSGGRTIALEGKANEALLTAIGAGGLPLEGQPPFKLDLAQSGDGPLSFDLDADLGPAGVRIDALDWVKPPGVPARLRAEGTQEKGVIFRKLAIDSPGLDGSGRLALDASGRLREAAFEQVRLPGRGTFAAALGPAPDGVLEVSLSGPQLDLSDRVDGAGSTDGQGEQAEPSTPVRLRLDVGRLLLGERIVLEPARGSVEQYASGALDGRFEGRLGGGPVVLAFDMPDVGPGTLRMTSPDAGAALRGAGFYSDARGGTLDLIAQIGAEGGISGEARIEDVQVRSQSTFRTMLRDGGMAPAEQAVSSGGIGFRKVVVPFTYRDGRLKLKNAIASSPMLALKVNGTVDERTDEVDLSGVLSPAYGLTGALNEVPVLGKILGGEGEGILAMTFRMRGPIEDPRFTVNPLSMLAPGFLRKIFTAPSGEVSEDFRESLAPANR